MCKKLFSVNVKYDNPNSAFLTRFQRCQMFYLKLKMNDLYMQPMVHYEPNQI
jgi:hypothetical protein